jgi:ABC-2 type transport system ATP-binding protein
MAEPIIDLRRVGCRVAGRWALQEVSLQVPPGELFGLVGPNGGGKSLLLAICATLIRPDTGSVRIGGHDVGSHTSTVRRLIGYLAEEIGWYPHMTVREDLEFFARAHGMRRDALRRATADALGRWGLQPLADTRMRDLSRGFLRRVGLARAWLHRPQLLLLDEPASGLDAEARAALTYELLQHLRDGGSAMIASHHMGEFSRCSHRLGVLAAGRLSPPEAFPGIAARSREAPGPFASVPE